jgi:hypothetical protein
MYVANNLTQISTYTRKNQHQLQHRKHSPGLPQHSALGKRAQHDGRETFEAPNNPTNKRACHLSLSSNSELCEECSAIPWNKIDHCMGYEGRVDWHGMLISKVGRHYRNVSPATTCPLCRQLYAPWIESFLRKLEPSHWKGRDRRDEIRIFRHLRHLNHVNDFQTSRNKLKAHDAPFHIAVVPFAGKWKEDFRRHIVSRGMAVVLPDGRPESDIFSPQQVSPTFDPEIVKPWLEYCKDHHKNHCSPKSLKVNGMKVIDCFSKDGDIIAHCYGNKYVALSYVWGNPPAKRAPLSTIGRKETPQMEITKYTDELPLSKLPNDIPLTIRDAIQVTRDLGYQFLWVDTYCINQKSEIEKQQQCSRMGDIYAGSQLTIFALGQDSEYGLPGVSSRPRFWQPQCTKIGKYQIISTMDDPHKAINDAKWSTRGWTLQEGIFSTRSLFFTDSQAYFECNSMNLLEAFKTDAEKLHIQSQQRVMAFHRAGKYVCGNSNKFSHLNVKHNGANHRKIDNLRRCQTHIQEYTKRELTNKDDVLNAFAGIARFYTQTTAKIASLAGLPIPSPIATSGDVERAHLDHLSYALSWIHHVHAFSISTLRNPKPQRRVGFPSWSWAGWFGRIKSKSDLPYCWTSYLSSVRVGFKKDTPRNFAWLTKLKHYRQLIIDLLLTANELCFDAHVLNHEKLRYWQRDPETPSKRILSKAIQVNLSRGPCSLEEFQQKLKKGKLECVIIGTYGEPRKDVYKAIQVADRKSPKAGKRRIDLFERQEPDAIVCLVVGTKDGISERYGLVKITLENLSGKSAVEAWRLGPKKRFILR